MAASGNGSASLGTPETENCSDIRLLLSALVDNEASPDEAARAKVHMASCADCASHFAFLRLTGRAFSQMPDVYPSASLSARIAAATYDKPTFAERVAGWLRPVPVRVGLGAALAAGLAMIFIVPRMGEVDTAIEPSSPSSPERGVSVAKDKPPIKEEGVKMTKPSLPVKPADVPVASAPKPGSPETKRSVASNLPSAAVKPPSVSIPAPTAALTKPKTAPVRLAKIPSSQVQSLTAAAATSLSASDIIHSARTEPQMDRNRNRGLRALGNGLKKPGTGNVTLPRSGYDRVAATEGRLKPRDSAPSTVAAAPSAGIAPEISPLLPENAVGNLAEPTAAIAERNVPRSPATAVASGESGRLRFRTNSRRTSGSESFPTTGLNRGGSSSAGDRYSFAAGSAARISISSAPVTGTD